MSDPKYAGRGSLYVRIAEECAEIIHIMMKMERFGPLNYHPYTPTKLNIVHALDEINDISALIGEFKNHFYHDFDWRDVAAAETEMNEHKRKVEKSNTETEAD